MHGDLDALAHTGRAVREVLRLYPAIPIFPREAAARDRLPSGHRVDAGARALRARAYTVARITFTVVPPYRTAGQRAGMYHASVAAESCRGRAASAAIFCCCGRRGGCARPASMRKLRLPLQLAHTHQEGPKV